STTPLEAVTLRAIVSAPPAHLDARSLAPADAAPERASRTVIQGGERLDAHSVWRRDLRAGHELEGPLVVQEYSGTTWVPPGWRLRVDGYGCLHLTRS
ncbi:MAG: hypothetical protein R3304_01400, partial [Longimicrobiales bacterium]|nr:hypothetical protein [Longimicrobiales bacterium]